MNLPEKKVKELIDLMNSMSSAAIPAQKPIIEMFNLAMDEKMLDYLLTIGTEYHTKEELGEIYHKLYGGTNEDWEAYWTEVITMSFVHPKNNEERHLYGLSPIFPGWVEFYTSGPMDEKRAAILEKFMEFWGVLKKLNFGPMRLLTNYKGEKKVKDGIPPRVSTYLSTRQPNETASLSTKTISINQPIEAKQAIHPAGDIYKLLEKNKDEIVICNCCVDCCLLYSGYREGGLSKIFARSFYKPEVIDESRCVGCNICAKFCPTEATYYDKTSKTLVFNYEKCIGCGQCVNQCKFDVRKMVKDQRDVFVKTKKKPR